MGFLDARMKVLIKNVFGSAAARFVNLFITLALVPLTINALSPTDYAYFAMAISLSVLAAYADLGMGLAVVNVVAQRDARPNSGKAQRAVSIVWFSLLGIGAIGLTFTSLVGVWANFGVEYESIHQLNAILLAAACVFAGLPTGLVQRVLFAGQKNVQANAWSTGARVLSLGSVWLLVTFSQANLQSLVFAVVGVPMMVGWLSVVVVFGGGRDNELRPKTTNFCTRLLQPYLVIGMSFLVMQLVPYVETGADIVIIGQIIDVKLVPAFDVYSKIFTYVPALISIAIFPLWPAIANANASGDGNWILKIRKFGYITVVLIALFVSFIFLYFSKSIILHWTGKDLYLDFSVTSAMAVFSVLTCIGTVQSMILSGLGEIKAQVKIYCIYMVLLILGKGFAAEFFGLPAMLWVLNIIYIFRLIYAERLFLIQRK